jgi:EmrB/QacA subfamily drug resistance transporter
MARSGLRLVEPEVTLAIHYRGILVATILASSLAFIDGSVVNVILPKIQAEFGRDLPSTLWVIQAYGLFLSTFLLLGGALGDHYGRKRIFQMGLLLFLAASTMCALSRSFWLLLLSRSVQGLGAAILTPGSLAIINATFPKERRGQAIGTWSAFSAVTAAVGPALGGWLTDTLGWRAAFFLNLPLGGVALWFSYRSIPENCAETNSAPLDFMGTLLSTLGIGGLVVALTERSFVAFLVGCLFLGAFWLVEHKIKNPILPFSIFHSRLFSLTNGLTFFLYAALGGGFFYLPLYLITVDGYTSAQAGLATLPFVLLLASLSRFSGGLLPRLGSRILLTCGPFVSGIGFGLLAAFAHSGRSYGTAYFPGIAVLGIGMAFTAAPLTSAVLGALEDAQSGLASGVNNAAARLAGLFGVSLTAGMIRALTQRPGSLPASTAIFGAMAALCGAAALTGAFLSPQLRDQNFVGPKSIV